MCRVDCDMHEIPLHCIIYQLIIAGQSPNAPLSIVSSSSPYKRAKCICMCVDARSPVSLIGERVIRNGQRYAKEVYVTYTVEADHC